MILVDHSILASVARCDTQALVRYHLGLVSAEPGAPLRAGIAFHEVVAAWLRGAPVDAAVTGAEAYVEWAKVHVDASDRLGAGNVLRVLQRFFDAYGGDPARLPFAVIDVEKRFSHRLAKHVEYAGKLDVLGVMPDGSFVVVDWKTTGKRIEWKKADWRMDAQFTGYMRIIEAEFGVRVFGAIVGAVEMLKLPGDAKRKCPDHGVVYAECGDLHAKHEMVLIERNPERIEAWTETALVLAQKWDLLRQVYPTLAEVATAPQQGQWLGACGYCEFQEWCRGGRDLEWARRNLRHEPWTPGGPHESDS